MGKKQAFGPSGAFVIVLLLAFQNCSKVQFDESPAASADGGGETQNAPSTLQGTVTNALTGLPLTGVSVTIVGADGQSFNLSTNSSGQFASPTLSAGTASVTFSLQGYITAANITAEIKSGEAAQLNQSLSPTLASGQLRIVLNWTGPRSGAVQDVDAYLNIPSDRWPIFFDSRQGTGANLDIDIVNWRGPETITITALQNGTYRYYVNNYDTRQLPYALGKSDVRVSVYQGASLVKTYTVPAGYGITYEVFQIVNGQIVDVMRYTEDLDIAY